MKLGIILLVTGMVVLAISIPFWVWGFFVSHIQLIEVNFNEEGLIYSAFFGVVVGLVMTIIGAIRVFKREVPKHE